jgi:hypothetical protein
VTKVIKIDQRTVVDYMARDYESLLRSMYAIVPSKLPEWTDFANQADFGNVMLEMFAHIGDILSYYQDRVANESFLATALTRRSVIEHLRLIGYTLATAAPAAASLDVTVAGTVNAVVTVSAGDAFATKSQKNKPSVRFEYTREQPLTIDFGAITAVAGKKTFKGLLVEEGRLINSELIGTSDGSTNQRFLLAHSRLIQRPIGTTEQARRNVVLLTNSNGTIDAWTQQETLAFSRAGQKDFVIEIDDADRATVNFGDGIFGAIPTGGAQILATYRVGGGALGNTPDGTIRTIVGAPQLALLGAQVTNPEPSSGGADRESIEHAVKLAPVIFRSLKRAVTADDYEALARSFKGVAKVQAKATGWNTVTLYVAPAGGGNVSDTLEANLRAFFEDKRMASQIVEVLDVTYVPIYVTIEIGVESYYRRNEVQAAVERAAAELLAFDNVDFGQTVYLSKFYEVGEAIAGVLYMNITEFRRGDTPKSLAVMESGKIELASNELPKVPDDPNKPDDAAYRVGARVTITNKGGV